MRILAIDYGTKKIGLAVSNQKGTIAFPFGIVDNNKHLNSALQKIIQKEGIKKIVVGIPEYNKKTALYKEVEKFIKLLKQSTTTPVETEDELLTSETGRKKMSLTHFVRDTHDVAAQVILESYLKAY